MDRYTCEITGKEYTIEECKACDGSGLEEWHTGCGDMGPATCRKCEGYGMTHKLYDPKWDRIWEYAEQKHGSDLWIGQRSNGKFEIRRNGVLLEVA